MHRAAITLVLLPLLCAPFLRADDVTTKDGKVHKDLTLVKETDKMLEFVTLDGKSVRISKENVATHERKPTARDEYKTRRAALKSKDAQGLFDLATWAREQGMVRDARKDYEAVLKIESGHAGAREALGFKLLDGKWLAEPEYKKAEAAALEAEAKAKGWKKWEDRWVSPVEHTRLEKGFVKHTDPELGGFWVSKDIKKKIDEDGWAWREGEWVSPKDREKIDAGQRMYKGRWMSIGDLDAQFSTFDNPWIVKDRHIELQTNAPHERAVKFLAMAEDFYVALAQIFGDVHPDLYGPRGPLVIVVAKSLNDYNHFGKNYGDSDRIAYHSSGFGGFFAPSYRAKDAKGQDIERGAGCAFMGADNDIARYHIGHVVAHAYLDRIVPEEQSDEKLVECMASYVCMTHRGTYAPIFWYNDRMFWSRDAEYNKFGPAVGLLEAVTYGFDLRKEKLMRDAGVMMHYLREKNPDAFHAFWRAYGIKDAGARKGAGGAVVIKGTPRGLLEACVGTEGKVDEAEVNKDFATFVETFKKTYKPWNM